MQTLPNLLNALYGPEHGPARPPVSTVHRAADLIVPEPGTGGLSALRGVPVGSTVHLAANLATGTATITGVDTPDALADDFTCACGNAAHLNGFVPAERDGSHTGDLGDFPAGWSLHATYACPDCGRYYGPLHDVPAPPARPRIPFVVRTADTEWLRRHDARPLDGDGRHVVHVRGAETFTFCGHQWLRHEFDSAPADASGQTVLACPQSWSDEAASTTTEV